MGGSACEMWNKQLPSMEVAERTSLAGFVLEWSWHAFWTTGCTRCDSLVEGFSRTARRSKKVTHGHYTFRNTPQTIFRGYSNVFSCFFLGIFQRKNTLQLDQIAARLPGFTIADAVTKPFQEWDLPRPSRSITPPRTNCNEIVGVHNGCGLCGWTPGKGFKGLWWMVGDARMKGISGALAKRSQEGCFSW